jgi:hypothetical protein
MSSALDSCAWLAMNGKSNAAVKANAGRLNNAIVRVISLVNPEKKKPEPAPADSGLT